MKKSISLLLSLTLFFGCCSCLGVAPAADDERYAAVYGGIIDRTEVDTVYYTRRDITDAYINPDELPAYLATEIANSCAVTAGGVIIGHYDLTYEELIPDHSSVYFMGYYTYTAQDEAVDAMFQELYTRMGSTSAGTTVAGYKNGMASYVQSKGRTIAITNIYNNSALNMSAYMTALQAGKLVTVFMSGLSIVYEASIRTRDGYDEITNTIINGNHAVAAYGYRNIRYYDSSDNLVQEDNYLYVHTGFSAGTFGMIRLNRYTNVDDGYVINIT